MSLSKPIREFHLEPFSGKRIDWPLWDQHLIEALRSVYPSSIFGATGLLLNAQRYGLQFEDQNNIIPFVAPIDPGEEPDAPPEDANALAISRYEMRCKRHYRQKDKHTEWICLSAAIYQTLKQAAPLEAMELIKDPIHGLLRVTIIQLYEHMLAMYGIMSVADLKDQLDSLLTPYDPSTSFATFVSRHARVHNLQASNGQEMREQEKISCLDVSTIPCGLFEARKSTWYMAHAAVAAQRFGGENGLSTALIAHDQSFPRTATAKMGGYTAAVIQPPPTVASLQAQLTALQGHQAAAAVPAQPPRGGGGGGRGGGGRRGGAGGGGRASRGRGRGAGPIYYCWTHGVNVSHVGADCRNKDPSHVDAATYFNPLGGN